MSFVTPALLAGIALIALPIVLHLVMRRQPQRLVFPALRFVQNRRNANQTRLKLRHLLLLLLRCGLIVALALALARPALRGSGKLAGKDAPIAAALVFDNSLRMDYMKENQTRLQRAQELADWLLKQLPASTPVAVLSGSGRHDDFSVDLGAATLKVQRLQAAANARPLGESISKAIELLAEKKDEYRPEVYVFTDLSAASWNEETIEVVADQLESYPELTLYLVDVGVLSPSNSSITDLRLASEIITTGSPLVLEAEIAQLGSSSASSTKGPLTVGLFLAEGADADYQKRGEKAVDANTDQVDFSLAGLPAGTHQGFVRLEVDDPLPADNTRYFTVEVRPPRKVLLISQEPEDGLLLKEALSAATLPGVGSSKFDCQLTRPTDLDQYSLPQFDAICLLDPGKLPKRDWQALSDYVQGGGGLGIFLGRSARRETLNDSLAAPLLPGSLRWQSQNETYLRPATYDHPILKSLSNFSESIPWPNFPVFTYWELSDLADDAHVVASFASGQPALVERPLGKGTVVTMTTPVSDAAYGDPWNLLPTGPDAWPFLALADGLVSYLCGGQGQSP